MNEEGKYYLLSFYRQFRENDVNALDCKTEEEYQQWLKTPSGVIREDYEQEQDKYDLNAYRFESFQNYLRINGYANAGAIPPEDVVGTELASNYRKHYKFLQKPIRVDSFVKGYGEDTYDLNKVFGDRYLMQEFVDNGDVTVLEVNKDFYDTFHKSDLRIIVQCNIFQNNINKDLYPPINDAFDEQDEEILAEVMVEPAQVGGVVSASVHYVDSKSW